MLRGDYDNNRKANFPFNKSDPIIDHDSVV